MSPAPLSRRGAYYPPQPYDSEHLFAGKAKVARVFDSNKLDPWGHYPELVRAYSQGVRIFSISWKQANEQALRAFAASRPSDVTVYGTYLHEPENEIESGALTLDQWKANTIAQAAVMREEGIIPTRILMGWTLFPKKSGRRVAHYDLPPGTIDVAAFDAHVRDKDPVRMARKLRKEKARTGLPLAVPETSGAPGHLKQLLKALPNDTRFVCYFSLDKITSNQSKVLFGGTP